MGLCSTIEAQFATQRKARRQWKGHSQGFRMPLETFNKILAEQQGLCALCADEMQTPHIDHCHETGAFRGLLCPNCNIGLGHFKDDVSRLAQAISYLSK